MQRVLIVDRDAAARTAIRTFLEYKGFDVVAFDADRLGRHQIGAGEFALAIVDIGMPGSDSLDTIRRLRAIDAELAIIAVSALALQDGAPSRADLVAAASDLGAAYILSKPFRPAELLETMNKCLGENRRPPTGRKD